MGKYDDKNYEVGKGKPPKKNRFKPKKSGNPKGRPKGRKVIKYHRLSEEAFLHSIIEYSPDIY